MSKNQQKTTFNTAAGNLNSLEPQAQNTLNTADSTLTSAGNAYGALNPAGIANIEAPATTASNNLISSGGYAAPQLNTLEGQEQTDLGGLNPNALSALSTQYQDLISSGGISDATAAAMQRQSVSGVGSVYGTLKQQLQNTQARTGGQGGGGETAQMARQLSQQEANAVTGVTSNVGQLRQQGTETGLSGASSLTAAQAAAQNAAANTFSGTQGGVASGVQTGTGLLSGIDQSIISGGLASAGGLSNIGNIQSGMYGTQLGAEQGLLNTESGIANTQQGIGGNILGGIGAIGNLAGGAGKLLTGIGSLGCWIAEAIYGIDTPKTLTARAWLNGEFKNTFPGNFIMYFYIKFGQRIAKQVRRYTLLKTIFKPLFDSIPGVKQCQ